MQDKVIELKQGIKLHIIKTDLYKTNLFGVWQTVKLEKETVTQNALVNMLQRRGTFKYGRDNDFAKVLEEYYGMVIDCSIDKQGDNESFKFLSESICDEYLPNKDISLLEKQIDVVLNMAFKPYVDENGLFLQDMVDIEKNKLHKVITSITDEKDSYAYFAAMNAMYGDNGYGLCKYGFCEEIDSITLEDLKNRFESIVNNSKIDIVISGKFDENRVVDLIQNNSIIKELQERNPDYYINNPSTEDVQIVEKQKEIIQNMKVTQGKLVMGYNIKLEENNIINLQNVIPVGFVYDVILGNGANSKLFQNVREKASLAYSIRSTFSYAKMNYFIRAGIDISKYKLAQELINKELQDMIDGNFDEQDIINAKEQLQSTIKTVKESQEAEMSYYVGQDIVNTNMELNDLASQVKSVTKEEIIAFAKLLHINTVYFLKDEI